MTNINSKGKNLIFLISQPRAGSTLLQLMLSCHPDIATTSEPWIALHPIYALRKKGIDAVYNHRSHLSLNALQDFLKQTGVNESFYKKQIATFLLSFYNQAIKHQNKKFFLDKTPRYYLIISELIELFPEAKFIILFRNPLAVLNSILKTWVKDDLSSLGDYRDDLMSAPQILIDFVKTHGNHCIKVNYEELVTKPDAILKEICNFLDITYYDNMIDYSDNRKSKWKLGDLKGALKRSRPISDPLESWKKSFVTAQERLFAVSYLKSLESDLIKEMGYNYNEILSSIDTTVAHSENNLISWETITSNINGFSKVIQLKRIIYQILSDESFLKENSDISTQNPEWKKIIANITKTFKDKKIDSLLKEIDSLRAKLNSASWNLMLPLRAFIRLLKKMINR